MNMCGGAIFSWQISGSEDGATYGKGYLWECYYGVGYQWGGLSLGGLFIWRAMYGMVVYLGGLSTMRAI